MLDALKAQWSSTVEAWPMFVPSSIFAFLLEYTGAHAEAFVAWCILTAADLVFGISVAVIQGNFKISKLYHWVGKTFVQLLTIMIFAVVLRSFAIASGVSLFFANWIIMFYILLDASSLLDKFVLLGLLPTPIIVLLSFLRKRVSKSFAVMAGEPKLARELENALKNAKPKPTPTSTPTSN